MDIVDILIKVLAGGGIFCTLLGLFVVIHIMRPQKSPADTSNRINKILVFPMLF